LSRNLLILYSLTISTL